VKPCVDADRLTRVLAVPDERGVEGLAEAMELLDIFWALGH
jgi:hypothetical protein